MNKKIIIGLLFAFVLLSTTANARFDWVDDTSNDTFSLKATFTDSDGTAIDSYTGEAGPNWDNSDVATGAQVFNGMLNTTVADAGGMAYLSVEDTFTCYVRSKQISTSDNGLMMRFRSSAGGWLLDVNSIGSNIQLAGSNVYTSQIANVWYGIIVEVHDGNDTANMWVYNDSNDAELGSIYNKAFGSGGTITKFITQRSGAPTHNHEWDDYHCINGTKQDFMDLNVSGPPPAGPTELSIEWVSPTTNTQHNTLSLDYVYNVNSTDAPFNCSLYENGLLKNETTGITTNGTKNWTVSYSRSDQDTFKYHISCDSNTTNTTTDNITIYVDNVNPIIRDNYNLFTTYNKTLYGEFNLSDVNLFGYSVRIDGVLIDSATDINNTDYIYNLSYPIHNLSTGLHELNITATDGHTAKEISNWKHSYNPLTKGLKYSFDKRRQEYVEVRPVNSFDALSSFDTNKLKDRYEFTYRRSYAEKMINGYDLKFSVRSSHKIKPRKSNYRGHLIVADLAKWIDFETDSEIGDIDLMRISDYEYLVTVKNVRDNIIKFKSIGSLNKRSTLYDFYKGNYSQTFSETVLEGSNSIFQINFSENSQYVSDINATLVYNGTPYTPNKYDHSNSKIFNVTVASPVVDTETNMSFYWNYTIESKCATLDTSNVVSWYDFDNDLDDSVGNNHAYIPSVDKNLAVLGTINSSQHYAPGGGYPASNAADNDNTTSYGNQNVLPVQLLYEYDYPVVVNRYELLQHSSGVGWGLETYNPKSWQVEGYNGTTWILLDTVSDGNLTLDETKSFNFNNTEAYTKYQLNFSAAESGNYVAVTQFDMFETATDDISYVVGYKNNALDWASLPNIAPDIVAINRSSFWEDINDSNWTIEFWTNVNQTGDGFLSQDSGISLLHDGVTDQLKLYGGDDATAPILDLAWNWSAALNNWQHVLLTKINSNYSLFIDGILINEFEDSDNIAEIDEIIALNFSQGMIDELRIWNKGMSQEEVTDILVSEHGCTPTEINQTETQIQTVLNFGIDDCSTFSNVSLNFTLRNEDDDDHLLNSTIDMDVYVYTDVSTIETGFNFTNVNNFQICINPPDANLTISSDIKYSYGNSYTHRYYLVNATLDNETDQISLYNLNDTDDTTTLTGFVQDEQFRNYDEVVTQLQRYYPASLTWKTVQMDRSDEIGQVEFHVYEQSEDYRFVFYKDNELLRTTSKMKILCDRDLGELCQITFIVPEVQGTSSDYIQNLTFDNDTQLFTLTWVDTTGITDTVRLWVYRETGARKLTICDTNLTASSGSLSCNITGQTGSIIAQSYRSASPFIPTAYLFINQYTSIIADSLGEEDSNLISYLIFAIIALSGIWGAVPMIWFSIFGLIALFILGTVSWLTPVFIIIAALIGMVASVVIRR